MKQTAMGCCFINETSNPTQCKVVDVNSDGRPVIEAVLQETDTLNRNKRYYRRKEMLNEINSERTRELLRTKNLFGEAGHPITTDVARQASVDPKCVSHLILDMNMHGDVISGKITSTNTEYGRFFADSIRQGTEVAFSLRALGTISNTPKGMVVTNPKLITYDWVIFPSFKNAYQTNIVESTGVTKTESGIILPKNSTNKFILESEAYDGCRPIRCNDELRNYISDKSTSIKDVITQVQADPNTFTLSENCEYISFTDVATDSRFVMPLESKIHDDILDYFGQI